MDASNLLKPMLARGELHSIGATTLDEYRKHIEKDAALERRFQPVSSTSRRSRRRSRSCAACASATRSTTACASRTRRSSPRPTLSDRYITERFLPDKAIDLVDEAASRLRMEIDSMPVELDELERRRIQLEIEREALRKEKDDASQGAPRGAREASSPTSTSEAGALKQRWEQEKAAIAAIRATK